jgi:hypothetical protein
MHVDALVKALALVMFLPATRLCRGTDATAAVKRLLQRYRRKLLTRVVWLREWRAGLHLQNYLAEHKLRAERRLGELLRDTVRAGNPQLLHGATISLADLGIERTASPRWQIVASLAPDLFEAYLAETRAADGLLGGDDHVSGVWEVHRQLPPEQRQAGVPGSPLRRSRYRNSDIGTHSSS